LAEPTDHPGTATPSVSSAPATGPVAPPDRDPAAGADLGRRRFFRQFAGDIANTAATVVGAAQALQRTSAEMAATLLDPTRVAGGAAAGSTATATPAPFTEWSAGPTFRTAFQVDPGAIRFVDQRALPSTIAEHVAVSAAEVTWAIRNEVVVGGPAIGQAAAIGLALTAARASDTKPYARRATLRGAANALRNVAPTVASVGWAVDRVMAAYEAVGELDEDGGAIAAAIQAEADAIVAEATIEHGRLVEHGVAFLDTLPVPPDQPLRLLVHGPSGTLAGGQCGTALAIAIAAHHAGRDVRILVPEGRPGLFGARISCWELAGAGMSNVLVPDAAAAGIVAAGGVDAVLVLADRIAVNGDVGAAVGSFGLAAAARHRGIPFLVCATVGSLDPATATGVDIVVGSRDVPELAAIGVEAHAPRSTEVVAPREDVVPASLVSDYVGANGLGLPAFPPARPVAEDAAVES